MAVAVKFYFGQQILKWTNTALTYFESDEDGDSETGVEVQKMPPSAPHKPAVVEEETPPVEEKPGWNLRCFSGFIIWLLILI